MTIVWIPRKRHSRRQGVRGRRGDSHRRDHDVVHWNAVAGETQGCFRKGSVVLGGEEEAQGIKQKWGPLVYAQDRNKRVLVSD